MDIQAAFEKAYWKLEPTLPDDKKDLAAATLRSIALNYIERKGLKPSKTLLKSINKLKKRDDIVITKPDKGSGVVVVDKSDYVRLLPCIFKRFHTSQDQNQSCIKPIDSLVLITLPFKDQKFADSVRKQLNDLGKKIDRVIQPVFTSRKISEDLKVTETKPSVVNQQCIVHEFQCRFVWFELYRLHGPSPPPTHRGA